jgi:hypothetical protein
MKPRPALVGVNTTMAGVLGVVHRLYGLFCRLSGLFSALGPRELGGYPCLYLLGCVEKPSDKQLEKVCSRKPGFRRTGFSETRRSLGHKKAGVLCSGSLERCSCST